MPTKVISETIVETLAVNAAPGQFAIIKTRNDRPEVIILNPREAEQLANEIDAWLPKAKKFLGVN
jgi:hypothetical protein